MNHSKTTNFHRSEEAFILSSLREVVNVWSRGSGQATFNLSIVDGFVDLQLGFRLGHPTDPHLLPDPVHPLHLTPDEANNVQSRKRKKGPARREKDRARAARHQARFQPEAAAVSTLSEEQQSPPVILPITGKLIQLKSTSVTAPAPAQPPAVLPSAAVPAATPPHGASPSTPATPHTKTAAMPPMRYVDVNCVKRHLFSSVPQNPDQKSPPHQTPTTSTKSYKRKEDELWTRLFK